MDTHAPVAADLTIHLARAKIREVAEGLRIEYPGGSVTLVGTTAAWRELAMAADDQSGRGGGHQ